MSRKIWPAPFQRPGVLLAGRPRRARIDHWTWIGLMVAAEKQVECEQHRAGVIHFGDPLRGNDNSDPGPITP